MSLWSALQNTGNLRDRFIEDARACITLDGISSGSCLGGRAEELRGHSVLVTTNDQFTAAVALIELDGIARQIVLCPPDLVAEHVSYIIDSVPVNAIVSDRTDLSLNGSILKAVVPCSPTITPVDCDRTSSCQTEWILLTSGTTGPPKMVVYTLSCLAGAIHNNDALADGFVWSTFYDIRRYGGLQILLRAILSGGSLVMSSAQEATADFLTRTGARGVTHMSGTPSHWRKALMSPAASCIRPQYVRLSGEIADQSILDHLRSFYPQTKIAHAFASTEAGVAFDVRDGLAGFPANLIEQVNGDVHMKVVDGSLRIRSPRTAARYLGNQPAPLIDPDGFVDTGDEVELRGDRYYFVGRRDGVINVGGLKVHPEEVESVINRHEQVRMSLVKMKRNRITGGLVVADVVLKTSQNGRDPKIEQEILQFCRAALPAHKVPALISFCNDLPVTITGKMVRSRA